MSQPRKLPRLATLIFERLGQSAMIEDLYGDLEEIFWDDCQKMPLWKAKLHFWVNALSLSFSYALKKRKQKLNMNRSSNALAIIKSYFTVGFRSLSKNKTFTILNMVGLSAGMSVSLLVVIILINVWNFDDFQENREQIHRITTTVQNEYGKTTFATTIPSLASRLKEIQPEAIITNVNYALREVVKQNGRELDLNGYFTDSNFLEIFTHPIISGDGAYVLDQPNTILLTQKAASRIFGSSNPINQVIETTYGDLIVAGVLSDIPGNSHMDFEALVSYATLNHLGNSNKNEEWPSIGNEYVYFLSDQPNLIDDFLVSESSRITALQESENIEIKLSTQDLRSMVLGSSIARAIGPSYPLMDAFLLFLVTMLILLPACFNYINLSIARALKRGKEVGLRKIIGSGRRQTILQFMIEALIICWISVIGALVIVWFIKDDFMSMLASGSRLNRIEIGFEGLVFAAILGLFTSILAGSAPAVYFSRLKPLEVIKSSSKNKSSGVSGFRKSLIVFQFALSIGFLIGIFSIIRQYQYTLSYDMGFESDNTLVVPLQDADPNILKSEFESIRGITQVSLSSHIPGTLGASSSFLVNQNGNDSLRIMTMSIDEEYLESLNIKILSGNNVSSKYPRSQKHLIVNQQFIESYGKQVGLESTDQRWLLDRKPIQVIGIVENFNISPIREKIQPLVIEYAPEKYRYATVSIGSKEVPRIIEAMDDKWSQISKLSMKSKYLSHHVEDAMSFYQTSIKVLGFQGILVIIISCLGLLGMVVFTTENRTKEIGLRKVLGASENNLIWTIGKSFFQLLFGAALIGSPVAYFLFNMALSNMQHYSYDIGIIEIIVPILTMFLIGGITIFLQTRSVAKSNPVENLRVE